MGRRISKEALEEEKALVAAAKGGCQVSFDRLTAPLRDKIYWRAVKAVKDRDQAEDVTQQTLLRAFLGLKSFRGDSRFSSWLYQVGTNCIRMHLRTQRRRAQERLEDWEHHLEAQQASWHLPADEALACQELVDAVSAAMDELNPEHLEALDLWVIEGLDLKQISKRTGASVAAIKSRLHRARLAMKVKLEMRSLEDLLAA